MSYATGYESARAKAQTQANAAGLDVGLERSGAGWTWRYLPNKANRAGSELRCEVVMCETLSKCLRGHGPCG
jgi:hypothetical protein